MHNFFIVFVQHLDEPGPPMVYRGDGGNVVIYYTRPEAEAAAARSTTANTSPNISFTVTEFQPL